MRYNLLIGYTIAASLVFFGGKLQAEQINDLLDERTALFDQLSYYEKQDNAPFADKSKKDLNNIISALRDIVTKDTEIISAMKEEFQADKVALEREKEKLEEKIADLEEEKGELKADNVKAYGQVSEAEAMSTDPTLLYTAIGIALFALLLLIRLAWMASSKRRHRKEARRAIVEMERLAVLKDNGLLPAEQFEAEKAQLLKSL